MYLNVVGQQQTHYWCFVGVNTLLNYLLLHTVLSDTRGLACLPMVAVSLIIMVVVVTLQVLFLRKVILAELAMCEHTVTKLRESNLRTNPSGHDSIGNNLQCGGIPHGDSHPIGM